MTVEAGAVHPEVVGFVSPGQELVVGKQIRMASYAVPVNNFPAGFLYKNNLWLPAKGEDCRMSQTVLRLEKIFAENIIMRNVAFVTVSFFAVRTVIPCRILRSHNMAVDTSFRLVAKI